MYDCNRGIFWIFKIMYVLYSTLLHLPPFRFHCVGECWIEPRTVATSALAVRRSSHSATSHPHSATSHSPLGSHLNHTRLHLIHDSATSHPRLGYISSTLGYISSTIVRVIARFHNYDRQGEFLAFGSE
jgi:hypothetical protein